MSTSEPVQQGQITEWPKSLVWAVYDTTTGASEALAKIQAADNAWLITNENSAVLVKRRRW